MSSSQTQQTLESKKKELEEERDRIKKILARRTHKDPQNPGNYITNFPNIGSDDEDSVVEDVQYEVDVDIEHVLEERLKKIEGELVAIQAQLQGT